MEELQPTPPLPAEAERPSGFPWQRAAAIGAAVLITILILIFADKIEQLKTLGYAGAFLIMLVGNATVILPAPGLAFVFAMSSTLNPWLLGLTAGTGAALGELTGYMAGHGGVTPMENTQLYERFDRWMDQRGPLVIFVLSIVPNPFFDIAGLLAGASHMPVGIFLAATWTGKIIQSILLSWAGALSIEWITRFFA